MGLNVGQRVFIYAYFRESIFKLPAFGGNILIVMRQFLLCLSFSFFLMTASGQGLTGNNCAKQRPVVFVHGFLGAGDTWRNAIQGFVDNGYCRNRLFVLDWNSLGGGRSPWILLDSFINRVLAQTGAKDVDLVGHSAGGGMGYAFLADSVRARKVAHYVHVGSFLQKGPAGGRPTLNIWSDADKVARSGEIPGAVNVKIPGADHYEVATSDSSFKAMYRFFTGWDTEVVITARRQIDVSGRVVSMGENKAQGTCLVTMILDPNPSSRGVKEKEPPRIPVATDSTGHWQFKNLRAGQGFLLKVDNQVSGKLYYYFPGFSRNQDLLYLRTFPSGNNMIGNLFKTLPAKADQTTLVIYSSNKAIVTGRDRLEVNGKTLSIPEFCSPEQTTISFFLFDDGNGKTDLKAAGGLGAGFPFLRMIDFYIPAGRKAAPIEIKYNGKTIRTAAIPSSEGVLVVVLD